MDESLGAMRMRAGPGYRLDAIKPTIGHLKHDHRMGRYYLKGEQEHSDRINALAAALGLNPRNRLAGLDRRGRCGEVASRSRSW